MNYNIEDLIMLIDKKEIVDKLTNQNGWLELIQRGYNGKGN